MKSISGILEVQNLSFQHSEVLICDFYEFVHFPKAEITLIIIFIAPKMAKIAVFELLDSPKLISRKIWVT